MDKSECIKLASQFFHIESTIPKLKNPDFQLKSHVLFYRGIFNELEELKILKITSKNPEDHICFDIYYISEEFNGLFNGYFRIEPQSERAEMLFQTVSRVCTDLGLYMYYLYQNSSLLKYYFISGSIQNAIEYMKDEEYQQQYQQYAIACYKEAACYPAEKIRKMFLQRELIRKYISDFIQFNTKCSEHVKMFLIYVLSAKYTKNIVFVNDCISFLNKIQITAKDVFLPENIEMPVFGLLEYAEKNNKVLLLRLEFDFEGGDCSVKTTY
ncbi:MAG: hypothetical protein ACOYVK_17975 [Bacillota bacterium]